MIVIRNYDQICLRVYVYSRYIENIPVFPVVLVEDSCNTISETKQRTEKKTHLKLDFTRK